MRSPYDTSSIGYSLTYSDIDSLANPREGFYATFNQDFAGAGGDATYVKSVGKLTGYYLLSEDADIVLKGSVSGGYIQPLGDDDLRVSDHFFLGGETIRGFETRGIGPRITAVGTQDANGPNPGANLLGNQHTGRWHVLLRRIRGSAVPAAASSTVRSAFAVQSLRMQAACSTTISAASESRTIALAGIGRRVDHLGLAVRSFAGGLRLSRCEGGLRRNAVLPLWCQHQILAMAGSP